MLLQSILNREGESRIWQREKLSYSAVPAKQGLWWRPRPRGPGKWKNLQHCPKSGHGGHCFLLASWSQCFLSSPQSSFQSFNSCLPGNCSQINKLWLIQSDVPTPPWSQPSKSSLVHLPPAPADTGRLDLQLLQLPSSLSAWPQMRCELALVISQAARDGEKWM